MQLPYTCSPDQPLQELHVDPAAGKRLEVEASGVVGPYGSATRPELFAVFAAGRARQDLILGVGPNLALGRYRTKVDFNAGDTLEQGGRGGLWEGATAKAWKVVASVDLSTGAKTAQVTLGDVAESFTGTGHVATGPLRILFGGDAARGEGEVYAPPYGWRYDSLTVKLDGQPLVQLPGVGLNLGQAASPAAQPSLADVLALLRKFDERLTKLGG
jgi:hypothetical protein